ncbi:MAG: aldose 1-epimerase family protein [Nocardioidaceae bacterium]|nr:aldose 1-epimerase family protein [Nocardioidaceae bacterium]MCL2614824.1 aldose 1-epimerase family protein [Nocardioidaceae bacterium]
MIAPSGDQYRIEADGYVAVVTESGGALRDLTYDGRHLIDGFGEDAMSSGGRGQVLMPWPNRIRDGRYTFDGREQQLALTEPKRGNASHGLVRWAAWSVVAREQDRVELGYRLPAQTGYPWTLDLRISYAVGADGLVVTQSATNLSDERAPYASGAHPYLVADASGGCDGWRMTLPAATRLLTDDERLLPAGREDVGGTDFDFRTPRTLGATVLDHAFTDLGPDRGVRLDGESGGVELWVDEQHRWVQVYTADDTATPRRSVAVEPMTAPPDAFNSEDDLVTLEPGRTFGASWGIRGVAGDSRALTAPASTGGPDRS